MDAAGSLEKSVGGPFGRMWGSPGNLWKNRARQWIRTTRWLDERLRRGLGDGSAGPIPEGFVAPQSKVSTFFFVASRLVEEFLAALPSPGFSTGT